MRKSATPAAPSDEQLKALGQLLAASRQQERTRRTERRLTIFYVVFGAAVFAIAALSGWWG
ncbi:MAG: hypothetical protein ACRDRA_04620 [Pseudonocardiaceae bacterium]